jgi:hypothetical protein
VGIGCGEPQLRRLERSPHHSAGVLNRPGLEAFATTVSLIAAWSHGG